MEAAGASAASGTLLSGAYIGMDAGRNATEKREFEELDVQPAITADVPGRSDTCSMADDLGSLDIGSPIYLRQRAGRPVAWPTQMQPDGATSSSPSSSPHPTTASSMRTGRWHASGVDVDLGAQVLHVAMTQSRGQSVLAEGIAFQGLPDAGQRWGRLVEAPKRTQFTPVRADVGRDEAHALTRRASTTAAGVRRSSVRGLAVGAPVEYRGLPIGEVRASRWTARAARPTPSR